MPDMTQPPTRGDVISAYQLLLGREPESEDAIEWHAAHHSDRAALLSHFLGGTEFTGRFFGVETITVPEFSRSLASQLDRGLAAFGPHESIVPAPGLWVDALGVQTACDFRHAWKGRSGQNVPEVSGEIIEWISLLDALAAATDRLCVVELGAGFGPWLVRGAVAWRRRHPDLPFFLIGIEGEPTHFQMLLRHMQNNDIPAENVLLVEGAVSEHDGEGDFEVAVDASSDWGTRIADASGPRGLPRVPGAATTRVRAVSLTTLTRDVEAIDLMHVDIQGSEVPVLTAAEAVLRTKVRRLLVGTHGRDVEGQLMAWLPDLGFRLVEEQACRYRCDDSGAVLVEDGAQYWLKGDAD